MIICLQDILKSLVSSKKRVNQSNHIFSNVLEVFTSNNNAMEEINQLVLWFLFNFMLAHMLWRKNILAC